MPRSHTDVPAILLCSWQGSTHLRSQLDSLAAQDGPARVHVHDDASTDGTAELASIHSLGARVVAHTRNVGVVKNFERGLTDVLAQGHRHVALADQDDVWRADRLGRGLAAMHALEQRHGHDKPLLVHSDLRMVDRHGTEIAPSFLRYRGYATSSKRHLAVMLGQCGVMGNTCLANRALLELALPFPDALHVHDWWLGLLAELYGARAFIDAPLVDYRIHPANASNSETTLHGHGARRGPRDWLARDFRLPFFEDSRLAVLQALLAGDGHRPVPIGEDGRLVGEFVDCLRFTLPRSVTLLRLLRGGYLRRSPSHRLRVAAALATTRRYPLKGPTAPPTSSAA